MIENTGVGWFEGVNARCLRDARSAIERGTSESPANWPVRAIEAEFASDKDDYYSKLHKAALSAAHNTIKEQEQADDQQLIHAVRAMDDKGREIQ